MKSLHRASNKAPVKLGKELGRGGEGIVSELADAPELVAKVYFSPADPRKARKLAVLARQSTPELQDAGAWPVDVLLDASGATRGVLMPRLDAFRELHELYTPKSRRQAFPDARFDFIVKVAESLARAVGLVHSLGHVIGDLNHGNAVVARDGRVRLIDCDSFQLRDAHELYTCDMGVALFTPPELQGQVLRGLERSAEHDAFGLAVLLFHLLFMGRHPFAGRSLVADMTIERAIAEGRFAYGAKAGSDGYSQPPGTLALDTFGRRVAELFERAFDGGDPAKRPRAVEWSEALQELQGELVACEENAAHLHPRARQCCWCEIESRTVRVWFGDGAVFGQSTVNLDAVEKLWRAIMAVPEPLVDPGRPARHYLAKEWLDSKESRGGFRIFILLALGPAWMYYSKDWANSMAAYLGLGAGVALGFYLLMKWWERDIDPAIVEANAEWLEAGCARITDEPFTAALVELALVRQRLLAIRSRPDAAIPDILERHAARERQKFLATLPLSGASLPEANREDRARLAAAGMNTAADVLAKRNELHHVVSYAVVRDLLNWAENRSAEFMLDPAAPMPADPDWAARDLEAVVEDLMGRLASGAELLEERKRQIHASLDALNRRAAKRMIAREMP